MDDQWVEIGKFVVRVYKTDEGVVCDVWDGEAVVASCYAFDAEVEEEA